MFRNLILAREEANTLQMKYFSGKCGWHLEATKMIDKVGLE